jgi:GT2 family glycosyltransferase
MTKKIVFCLPGCSFSREFLISWTETLNYFITHGYIISLSTHYDANVYYTRTKCLGVDVMRGIKQKPFEGKVDYDFLFWIDSDIVFSHEDILKLINHNVDIMSGCYIMKDNNSYPIVENFDYEFFLKNSSFEFIDRKKLECKKEVFPAAYVGFGFLCIKKGVFEAMDYPYFEPVRMELNSHIQDYASEDVSWCIKAGKHGFKILVDPTVKVGHQKTVILQ